MFDKRIYWLWLVMAFGPANPRIWQLGERFTSAETLVRALLAGEVRHLSDEEKIKIKKINLVDAEKLLKDCERKGIKVYCYESEGYPQKLKRISNPPSVLFCYGNLDFLNDSISIAVVGTREPTAYSLEVTKKLSKQLLQRGFYLTSGFAAGLDRIANEISLENKIPSAAIMGTAIDNNRDDDSKLKMKIAENGAVVSEYCSYFKVPISSFTQRNRILVGVSDAVLFCECSEKSKGLNNAKHAEIQGKSIFVIPPSDIFDPRYFGQRNLIRNGACEVFCAADIAAKLAYEDLEMISAEKDYKLASDYSAEFESEKQVKKRKNQKRYDKKTTKSDFEQNLSEHIVDFEKLNENQRRICEALKENNLLVDEIVYKTGCDVSVVLSELIELELEGIIKAYPGKIYGI